LKLLFFILILFAFSISSQAIEITTLGDVFIGEKEPVILDEAILDSIKTSNNAFANIEGPICDLDEKPRVCRGDPKTCYLLKMPSSSAKQISDWGIKYVSFANNHIYDFGKKCFQESENFLKKEGVLPTGLKGSSQDFEWNGIKVSFLAFHTAAWANDIYDLEESLKLIRKKSQESEVVILSIHAGAEGESAADMPQGEEYDFGERRGNIRDFSRRAIEAGADFIFAHGPHVVRALEYYNNKLIAYSLGNFYTFPGFNLKGILKNGAVFRVKLSPDGDFIEGHLISTIQSLRRVEIDKKNKALKLIIKASKKLNKMTSIQISDQGDVTVKKSLKNK